MSNLESLNVPKVRVRVVVVVMVRIVIRFVVMVVIRFVVRITPSLSPALISAPLQHPSDSCGQFHVKRIVLTLTLTKATADSFVTSVAASASSTSIDHATAFSHDDMTGGSYSAITGTATIEGIANVKVCDEDGRRPPNPNPDNGNLTLALTLIG